MYTIIFFYVILLSIFYLFKTKVSREGIALLLRTKVGLKTIDIVAKKFREWIILLGYISAGVGWLGLIFITYTIIKSLYDTIFLSAANGVSLVLPGINVPGLGILNFWYWILGIFAIASIHEFGHAVIARAHNLKVKHTGIVLFGPIIGAFVEPDEKEISQSSDIIQYSVLSAGAFFNIILTLFCTLILMFTSPLEISEFSSVSIGNIEVDGPAYNLIEPNFEVKKFNDEELLNAQDFVLKIQSSKPGDIISLSNDEKSVNVTLSEKNSLAYLGVSQITENKIYSEKSSQKVLVWINGLLKWTGILSLGIGLFNLLPIPILDGGKMVETFSKKIKNGKKYASKLGLFLIVVLVLNLIYPMLG